ncbi:MAG: hypothetical protein M1514_00310 [Patescibacteria group bacterium]|nr:hypothetical protein [Patescibacteria group bacterium]
MAKFKKIGLTGSKKSLLSFKIKAEKKIKEELTFAQIGRFVKNNKDL